MKSHPSTATCRTPRLRHAVVEGYDYAMHEGGFSLVFADEGGCPSFAMNAGGSGEAVRLLVGGGMDEWE